MGIIGERVRLNMLLQLGITKWCLAVPKRWWIPVGRRLLQQQDDDELDDGGIHCAIIDLFAGINVKLFPT